MKIENETSEGGEASGVEVRSHIRDPWAQAPVRLIEAGCGLGVETRLVLIYLLDLSRRPQWKISVAHIQKALGVTKYQWQKARRELETKGYLTVETQRRGGKFVWVFDVYDWPHMTQE